MPYNFSLTKSLVYHLKIHNKIRTYCLFASIFVNKIIITKVWFSSPPHLLFCFNTDDNLPVKYPTYSFTT